MISPSRIEEIRRLLNWGKLSQRAIARQTGVSRGTVQAIAEDRHRPGSGHRTIGLRGDFTPPSGLPIRCPGCGAKVQMPCLACYVQETKARRRNSADPGRRPRGSRECHKPIPWTNP
jgi:hypothetical protein